MYLVQDFATCLRSAKAWLLIRLSDGNSGILPQQVEATV